MKINLVQVDGGMPNLALMKISMYYKRRGAKVTLNGNRGDLNFVSCIFDNNRRQAQRIADTLGAELGGWGAGNDKTLPDEIEHIAPDYNLYEIDYSMGYCSRGCIRRCPWCIVPSKEGEIKPWASIYEFWDRRHRDIVLLDNNLLAAPNWKEVLHEVLKEKLRVDFNQGLDIRLLNDEKAHYLGKLKYRKRLRFSFDELGMEGEFREGMKGLLRAGVNATRIMIYILIGFDSTLEQDMERLRIVREFKADPFIMRYRETNGVKPRVKRDQRELNEFARWVNFPRGFYKHISFERWLRIRRVPGGTLPMAFE